MMCNADAVDCATAGRSQSQAGYCWQHIPYQMARPLWLHHNQTLRSTLPLVVEAPTICPACEQKPLPETATSLPWQTGCAIHVVPA